MSHDSEDDYDVVLEEEFDGDDAIDDGAAAAAIGSPARLLAVRRAIEARRDAREMDAALNYLELDFEDEE